MKILLFVAAVAPLLLLPAPVSAHREDYLNKTFVYETVEPKALELEYWTQYGSAATSPVRLVEWQQSGAVEYGITGHWMVEGNVTFRRLPGGEFRYLDTRVESRFRLFEEGDKFLDPAFSVEYTHSNEDGRTEHIIEPTFVVSKDFSRLNITFDFSLAKAVNTDEKVEAGYAVASRYDFRRLFRVGLEAQGEFTHNAPHYIIPQIHLLLPHDITPKLGVGIRHSGEGEKLFLKFILEVGLELGEKEKPGK